MRIISVQQPAASLIVNGFRFIDLRTHRPAADTLGTRIALYASCGKPSQAVLADLANDPLPRCFGINPSRIRTMRRYIARTWQAHVAGDGSFDVLMPTGAVVGTAVIRKYYERPSGVMVWVFTEVRRIHDPIPMSGAGRTWWTSAGIPLRAGTSDAGSAPHRLLMNENECLTNMLRSYETPKTAV